MMGKVLLRKATCNFEFERQLLIDIQNLFFYDITSLSEQVERFPHQVQVCMCEVKKSYP